MPVTVEWERPAWVVRWRDGPTRDALVARAVALGGYRVGRPLLVEEMVFSRGSSAEAIALGWLAVGGPASPAGVADAMAVVEEFCETTGYPQSRFDDRARGAADLLVRLSRSDRYEMGRLLAGAAPAVPPVTVLPDTGPALGGRTESRWYQGGPPEELLGPTAAMNPPAETPAATEREPAACRHCGKPLPGSGRPGRPATYCSGSCRTAAHRSRRAAASTVTD